MSRPMRVQVFFHADDRPLPAALEQQALAGLPAARQARWNKPPDEAARRQTLSGWLLLRAALHAAGADAAVLSGLRYAASGKPLLPAPWKLSIAHCRGRVACALSADAAVGLDIECLDEAPRAVELPHYLGAAERAWAGSDPARALWLWTAKEAVVKAAGAAGLRDIAAVAVAEGRARYAQTDWLCTPLDLGDGVVACLASPQPPELRVTRWEAAEPAA